MYALDLKCHPRTEIDVSCSSGKILLTDVVLRISCAVLNSKNTASLHSSCQHYSFWEKKRKSKRKRSIVYDFFIFLWDPCTGNNDNKTYFIRVTIKLTETSWKSLPEIENTIKSQ